MIDLRSDTVTKPTDGMREVMAAADVGDDVFRDDPTILTLEERVAQMTGKEAALFVPSGTMGNLICVLAHCWERGAELLVGDKAHIHIYEQGGISQLGGVHPRTLTNKEDGTFSLEELEYKVRADDPHLPVTTLVAIENTHNKCGGRVLPMSWLRELGVLCRKLGLPLHCDGARLFNAAVSLDMSLAELLQGVDSASLCLSKGLGCPVGSVIVGSRAIIGRALRIRKALGGGLRQVGLLGACGLYALDNNIELLKIDHAHASDMAKAVEHHGKGSFVPRKTDTNLVLIWIDPVLTTPEVMLEKLKEEGVLGVDMSKHEVRLAFHLGINSAMAADAKEAVIRVIDKLLAS